MVQKHLTLKLCQGNIFPHASCEKYPNIETEGVQVPIILQDEPALDGIFILKKRIVKKSFCDAIKHVILDSHGYCWWFKF